MENIYDPNMDTSEHLPMRRGRVISVREGGIDVITKLDPVDYTYSVLRILRHKVTCSTFTTLISRKIRHLQHHTYNGKDKTSRT